MATIARLGVAGAAPPASSRPAPEIAPVVPASTTTLVVTKPPPVRPTTPPPAPAKPTPGPTPAPTPTPRPTPQLTPTPPPQQFHYRFAPPLSPEEARTLIHDCERILNGADPATFVSRCHKAVEIIDATIRYLTVLDQRTSTLDSYKWYFIDREQVSLGMIDHDTFRAQPMIANASAISLAVDNGDVYVYAVGVYDAKGEATTFPLASVLEQNHPQRKVCYLNFPTTIGEVMVKYEVRRSGMRAPHVAVFAGVAREQEYLKQAVWYLHYSRREILEASRNPAAGQPHIDAACANLRLAQHRLILFRVKDMR